MLDEQTEAQFSGGGKSEFERHKPHTNGSSFSFDYYSSAAVVLLFANPFSA
ncbi:MAG: hypothetical protein HC903_05310 [Methylacidiphilales bacterium]|nr:hypothetical protein [Candidatus Methylacidiphilales bacterium]